MKYITIPFLLFLAFMCSRMPMRSPVISSTDYISLVALGTVDPITLTKLQKEISSFYHVPVTQLPMLAIPSSLTPRAGKYPGTAILDFLQQTYPNQSGKIIAITTIDISTLKTTGNIRYPNWGIFGIAYLGGPCTVVSTQRISSFDNLTKTCLHELGHCYGLSHCPTKTCMMHEGGKQANTQINGEHKSFCPHCKSLL